MKTKIFIKKINDKYYNNDISVIVCERKLLEEYLLKKFSVKADEIGSTINPDGQLIVLNKDNEIKYIVWQRNFSWTVIEMGMLNHEILHLVFDVMTNIGFKYCPESEEAYTYYMQILSTDIYWKLRKLR